MLELKEVRAISVNLEGKIAWVRTDIKGNAVKIFRAMGIAIPPKLLKLSSENQSVKSATDVVPQGCIVKQLGGEMAFFDCL